MKKELQEQARYLRETERKSLKEISDILKVSKASVSLWCRDIRLSPEEIASKSQAGQQRKTYKSARELTSDNPYTDLSSVKKGKAAELFAHAECLLRGLNVFPCITEDSKVDFIIGNGARVQVKVIGNLSGTMALRKVGCNSKTNVKQYLYTKNDIDFFIGVYLETRRFFVVPIEDLSDYTNSIALTTLVEGGYENAFDLLVKNPEV